MTAGQLGGKQEERHGKARQSLIYKYDGQSGPRVTTMPSNAKCCSQRPIPLASLTVCSIEQMERDARHLATWSKGIIIPALSVHGVWARTTGYGRIHECEVAFIAL